MLSIFLLKTLWEYILFFWNIKPNKANRKNTFAENPGNGA